MNPRAKSAALACAQSKWVASARLVRCLAVFTLLAASACFTPVAAASLDGGPPDAGSGDLSFDQFAREWARVTCEVARGCCEDPGGSAPSCPTAWTFFPEWVPGQLDAGVLVFAPELATRCLAAAQAATPTCPAKHNAALYADPSEDRWCVQVVTGKAAEGAPCFDNHEYCQAGLICVRDNRGPALCGVYGLAAGDACKGGGCDSAYLFCNNKSGRCEQYLSAGEACDQGEACGGDSVCDGHCHLKAADGAACTDPFYCAGLLCEVGRCASRKQGGAACTGNAECAAGVCSSDGTCLSTNQYCF